MSGYQSIGLPVLYGDPMWYSNRRDGLVLSNYNRYEHIIQADGGFQSCTIGIASNETTITDWFNNGLGRDIKVYNTSGGIVWEGFVNRIVTSAGAISIVRGPLMEVTNRCFIAYTPYTDITVDPPARGLPTITTIAENDDSQAFWGIQEDVVSGGTLIDAATVGGGGANEASEMRDVYLAEFKDPEVSQSLSAGAGDLSISIECRGYYDWLTRYIYDNNGVSYTTIPAKMEDVLGSDPNSIISTNYSHISDGTDYLLLVPVNESDYKKASTIIEELVSQGDANDKRTIFGIYEDRLPYFAAIPDYVEYRYRLFQEGQQVTDMTNRTIDFWDIRPGRWMEFPDFPALIDSASTELRSDPRNMFIESVRFTAPNGLDISGSRTGTFRQLLAKRGVGL